jgi:hypothetical protein
MTAAALSCQHTLVPLSKDDSSRVRCTKCNRVFTVKETNPSPLATLRESIHRLERRSARLKAARRRIEEA